MFYLFVLKHVCSCFTATLLVAVNEIKKSARHNGLTFYEYGLYTENPLFWNNSHFILISFSYCPHWDWLVR